MANVVIMGGSRGIGLAVACHLVARSDRVLAVSRTPSSAGDWVPADVSTREGVQAVGQAVGGDTLDALLYMGGTWEADAFTPAYSFAGCSDEDLTRVLNVNLLSRQGSRQLRVQVWPPRCRSLPARGASL